MFAKSEIRAGEMKICWICWAAEVVVLSEGTV